PDCLATDDHRPAGQEEVHLWRVLRHQSVPVAGVQRREMLGDDRLRAALALERRQLLLRAGCTQSMPRAPIYGMPCAPIRGNGDGGSRDEQHRQPDDFAHVVLLILRTATRGTPIVGLARPETNAVRRPMPPSPTLQTVASNHATHRLPRPDPRPPPPPVGW